MDFINEPVNPVTAAQNGRLQTTNWEDLFKLRDVLNYDPDKVAKINAGPGDTVLRCVDCQCTLECGCTIAQIKEAIVSGAVARAAGTFSHSDLPATFGPCVSPVQYGRRFVNVRVVGSFPGVADPKWRYTANHFVIAGYRRR